MNEYRVKTIADPSVIHIDAKVPGSKSMTNRALLLAAMAQGQSVLHGVLFSEDTEYFLTALKQLGFELQADRLENTVQIVGRGGEIPQKEADVFVGNAGTAARFLTAFLAMSDGVYHVDAKQQMKNRPMRELFDALKALGAQFIFHEEENNFPFTVTGIGKLNPQPADAVVELNIDRSSQFLSALLMTAPVRFAHLIIYLTGARSAKSYVQMTQVMMRQFAYNGLEQRQEDVYEIRRGMYLAQDYQIEPDVSAACYFYAMAAVTGASAVVQHMRRDSLQGDMRFLDVLEQMGCMISRTEEQILLKGPRGGNLSAVTASFADFSDQVLTMAAIAPYADGPVNVMGIAHIRGQESNRIEVICTELGKLGIRCEQTVDSLTIFPGTPHGGTVETYHDHRVAMAFAIMGLRTDGIVIANPECCKKTFPDYFEVFEQQIYGNARFM